jgi:hypothetical protein
MQRAHSTFQTEVEFVLPKGYLDANGVLHRRGVMRLATAADEILPLRDPRVQQNPAYLAIIVLSRVITRLGDLPGLDTKTVEAFYASDLDYLQRLYERINSGADPEAGGAEIAIGTAGGAAVQLQAASAAKGFRAVGEA